MKCPSQGRDFSLFCVDQMTYEVFTILATLKHVFFFFVAESVQMQVDVKALHMKGS